MKTVGVYFNTTAGGIDNHKQLWVSTFAEGVNQWEPDYKATLLYDYEPQPEYDYSFCFSYQGEAYNPHNKTSILRKMLQAKHEKDGKIFFMDSDVLISYQRQIYTGSNSKRRETVDGLRYVRLPYKHVHHPKATHFLKDDWKEKWENIKKNKSIVVKPYMDNNGPILLVCNRGAEGYGGGGKNASQWAKETIEQLTEYTERHFVVRFHVANTHDKTGDVKRFSEWVKEDPKLKDRVVIHNPDREYPNLIKSIRDSYAVVTYASSAAAPAIIEGRHVFVTSPTCFFYPESAGDLGKIENPQTINRDEFFRRYCHSHWTLPELRDGLFWRNVKDEI